MKGMRWLAWGSGVVALWIGVVDARADGMKVEPGQWEFTTTTSMPMAGGAQTQVTQECVQDGEMSTDRLMEQSDGCTVSEAEATETTLRWKITCTNAGGVMRGNAEFSTTGTEIRGVMKMAMSFGGNEMKFENTWQGKRLGPCE